MLDQSVVLIHIHQPLSRRADLILRMDVQHFLAAVDAERHITAGNDDRRNIQTRRRHKMSGNN